MLQGRFRRARRPRRAACGAPSSGSQRTARARLPSAPRAVPLGRSLRAWRTEHVSTPSSRAGCSSNETADEPEGKAGRAPRTTSYSASSPLHAPRPGRGATRDVRLSRDGGVSATKRQTPARDEIRSSPCAVPGLSLRPGRLSHKSDARDRSLFRGIIFVAIGIQKASDRLISEVELATPVDH
jgi:hypothetical protein